MVTLLSVSYLNDLYLLSTMSFSAVGLSNIAALAALISTLVLLLLVLRNVVFPVLTSEAWDAAVARAQKKNPRTAFGSGAFFSPAPVATSVEVILQALVHWPIYSLYFLATVFWYFPRAAFRRFFLGKQVSERDVWDMLTSTTLLLL
jgi:hypothetical protein